MSEETDMDIDDNIVQDIEDEDIIYRYATSNEGTTPEMVANNLIRFETPWLKEHIAMAVEDMAKHYYRDHFKVKGGHWPPVKFYVYSDSGKYIATFKVTMDSTHDFTAEKIT